VCHSRRVGDLLCRLVLILSKSGAPFAIRGKAYSHAAISNTAVPTTDFVMFARQNEVPLSRKRRERNFAPLTDEDIGKGRTT